MKSFVVVKHEQHEDSSEPVAVRFELSAAEQFIRDQGEVLSWETPSFSPLGWAHVRIQTDSAFYTEAFFSIKEFTAL